MRKIKPILAAVAAFGLMTASSVHAATNLVTNGTFGNASGASSTGWTASPSNFTGAPLNEVTTACGSEASCAVLNDYPNTLVTMNQSIAGLTVGQAYNLTWDMASYYGGFGSSTIPGAGAAIDGNSYLFAIGNDTSWKTYSETFTYVGASNVLNFYSQANGTDTDAAFTNISITAVPEPATWAMMILGMGAMGAMLRNRRQDTLVKA